MPGGGGVSTAADLALFYQALLHDPVGIWKPEVLADVTSNVRNSFPDYMGTPANRTRSGSSSKGDDERAPRARHGPHRLAARRSGTTARAVRSRGLIPRPGCRSAYLTNGIDEHELRQWRRGSAIASRAGNCVIA